MSFQSHLIELSGNVKKNPGLKPKSIQSFLICHWNLNSISSYNFSKIQSLIAYNCIHNLDIVCLSETYLDSDISSDNENLEILDYEFTRSDHPSNNKRGGVCIFLKFT